MLDSIYHMTNTLKSDFWGKNVIVLSLCTQRCYATSGLSILLHDVISLPDATSYDNINLSMIFECSKEPRVPITHDLVQKINNNKRFLVCPLIWRHVGFSLIFWPDYTYFEIQLHLPEWSPWK